MDPVYLCVVSKSVFESSDQWEQMSTIVVHLSEAQVEPIKNRNGKLRDAMNEVTQLVASAIPVKDSSSESKSIEIKPPLGIQPRHLWIESRRDELYSAINRYREHMKHVPTGWLSELLEPVSRAHETRANRMVVGTARTGTRDSDEHDSMFIRAYWTGCSEIVNPK